MAHESREPRDLRDPAADLLLGGRCAGCERPGRVLCGSCRAVLPRGAWRAPGAWVAGSYDGVLRGLVVAHKERGVTAVRPVLSLMLARALAAGLDDELSPSAGCTEAAPVLLVPVPSRRAAVRERGDDQLRDLADGAARWLDRAAGERRFVVVPLLRLRPGVRDQAGLDAGERAANLHGSMAVRATALRRLASSHPRGHVVVVDDVVTTGSTLHEAARALTAVGLRPLTAAAIAATPRTPRVHTESSALGPFRGVGHSV